MPVAKLKLDIRRRSRRRPLTTRDAPALLPLLAATGFLSLVATRVCDGMLPALSQAFSASTSEAAATISAYAIAYGVMQLVYGPLGDRFGKPRVILFATAWSAISSGLAAAAPSLETLVMARAAMGAGTAAIVPLGIAWIGDHVALAQRQQVLARYSGVTVLGIMVGPLAGGLLAQTLSWRTAFALLSLSLAAMSVVLWIRERRPQEKTTTEGPNTPAKPYRQQVGNLLAAPWARRILLAGCVEAGLAMGCLAFVPTVLHDRFGLTLLEAGAVAATFGVGGFLFSRAAAHLLHRFSRPNLPAIAGGLLAIAFGLLAAMPHWGWAIPACVLAGFGFFVMHNTLQVQATQLSPGGTGLAVSLFAANIFVGQSLGVVAAASVVASVGSQGLFGFASLGLLALGLALRKGMLRRHP